MGKNSRTNRYYQNKFKYIEPSKKGKESVSYKEERDDLSTYVLKHNLSNFVYLKECPFS